MMTTREHFEKKAKEAGYDDFLHYCDCRHEEQQDVEIVEWTDKLLKGQARFTHELRDKFFKECTTETPLIRDLKKINMTPHNVFEWFQNNIE